jgi:hypothetical protein
VRAGAAVLDDVLDELADDDVEDGDEDADEVDGVETEPEPDFTCVSVVPRPPESPSNCPVLPPLAIP